MAERDSALWCSRAACSHTTQGAGQPDLKRRLDSSVRAACAANYQFGLQPPNTMPTIAGDNIILARSGIWRDFYHRKYVDVVLAYGARSSA